MRRLRRNLLAWFANNARVLPWRTTPRDPYAVWVSEVMLQQTRVTAVVPYFDRFLAKFPDVKALARADMDDVLTAWSGLGYYRRARAMHQAARIVVAEHDGVFPSSASELRTLPGIGAYTSAAIASIAFGESVAVVDGNVERVVARLLAETGPTSEKPVRARIEQRAQGLLDPSRAGTFNEAMMELGATVCLPRAPTCMVCPVRGQCEGHRLGIAEQLPTKSKRPPSPRVQLTALLLSCDDDVLLCRRKQSGLFGGLWEPPTAEGPPSSCKTFVRRVAGRRSVTEVGSIEHVLTHRILEVHVLCVRMSKRIEVALDDLGPGYDRVQWMSRTREKGISTLTRRLLAQSLGGAT